MASTILCIVDTRTFEGIEHPQYMPDQVFMFVCKFAVTLPNTQVGKDVIIADGGSASTQDSLSTEHVHFTVNRAFLHLTWNSRRCVRQLNCGLALMQCQ
jgi:hypothetical protein